MLYKGTHNKSNKVMQLYCGNVGSLIQGLAKYITA